MTIEISKEEVERTLPRISKYSGLSKTINDTIDNFLKDIKKEEESNKNTYRTYDRLVSFTSSLTHAGVSENKDVNIFQDSVIKYCDNYVLREKIELLANQLIGIVYDGVLIPKRISCRVRKDKIGCYYFRTQKRVPVNHIEKLIQDDEVKKEMAKHLKKNKKTEDVNLIISNIQNIIDQTKPSVNPNMMNNLIPPPNLLKNSDSYNFKQFIEEWSNYKKSTQRWYYNLYFNCLVPILEFKEPIIISLPSKYGSEFRTIGSKCNGLGINTFFCNNMNIHNKHNKNRSSHPISFKNSITAYNTDIDKKTINTIHLPACISDHIALSYKDIIMDKLKELKQEMLSIDIEETKTILENLEKQSGKIKMALSI